MHPRVGPLILFLGVVTFLTAIGNTGLISIMPAIGRMIGMADYLVASIFSLSAFTWAISSPFWTRHVAGHGCNLFIRAGLIGFSLSMAGCAGAVALGMNGIVGPLACFLIFFFLRAIFGLLGSASAIATQTLVARNTLGADRTRALTSLAGALSLGTIVGPAVAPFLMMRPLGATGPMLAYMMIGLLTLAASFLLLPHERRRHPEQASVPAAGRHVRLQDIWRQPATAAPLNFGIFLCCAQAINIYTTGFVLIDRSGDAPAAAQTLIGLTMTGGALAALTAQWALPRLVAITPRRMTQLGGTLALLGNLIPLVGDSALHATIGFIVASFGYGLGRPGYSAQASLAGTDEQQVAIATAVSFIAGASITLPPIIATAAYGRWHDAPFALAIVLAVAALGFVVRGAASRAIVHSGQ
ncbi:MFS transporter [Sphingomonas sp.]|uniref:MFS transporter n=1 Tax=Sphingomonas sp. TaxID=28214 RepID=UPI0025E3E979|nr:MFS transporter [Sphingomonas sp.]